MRKHYFEAVVRDFNGKAKVKRTKKLEKLIAWVEKKKKQFYIFEGAWYIESGFRYYSSTTLVF